MIFFGDPCAVCPLYGTILCNDCYYPDDPEDDEEVF